MRTVLVLAASLALGPLGVTMAQAAPAIPQHPASFGYAATTVDWHPSTSHWDHHYHSHQDPTLYRDPAQAERSNRRVRNPEWSEYRPRGDRRPHRY